MRPRTARLPSRPGCSVLLHRPWRVLCPVLLQIDHLPREELRPRRRDHDPAVLNDRDRGSRPPWSNGRPPTERTSRSAGETFRQNRTGQMGPADLGAGPPIWFADMLILNKTGLAGPGKWPRSRPGSTAISAVFASSRQLLPGALPDPAGVGRFGPSPGSPGPHAVEHGSTGPACPGDSHRHDHHRHGHAAHRSPAPPCTMA